jgi:hypothetical protein
MSGAGKTMVMILVALHILIAGFIVVNQLSSNVILNASEAGHAQFAYQAGQGQSLYGDYDVNIQPLHYTPLTFQLVGWFSRLFGYDIRAMRFVIVLFAAGAIFLLGRIIFLLTKNHWLAWVGAGLYCGLDVDNCWYIALEPNVIHVFFALLGLYVLLKDPELKWKTVVLSMLCLFASFWSKHTGLGYIAAGVFYYFTKDLKKGLAGAALAAVLVVGSSLYFILKPGSTFLAMMLTHGGHALLWSRLFQPVLFPEYMGRFGVMFAFVIGGLLVWNKWSIRKWLDPFYIFLGAAAVVGTITRLKYGSGPSQAIFFYGLVIAGGLVFVNRFLQEKQLSGTLALSLLAVQALALFHDVTPSIITAADKIRYQEVMNILATPGKVTYYNNHGFMNVLAGKQPYINVGLLDRSPLIRNFYSSDPFDLVIIGVPLEDSSGLLYERLEKAYTPIREIPADPRGPNQTLRYRMIVFAKKDQAAQPPMMLQR